MEIIKRGKLPSERTYTTSCGVCKTEFRCSEADACGRYNDWRDGDYLTIKCPVCNNSRNYNVVLFK